ncbi:hypothetical protein V5O48_018693, partial [Marasmius crinis-equi]
PYNLEMLEEHRAQRTGGQQGGQQGHKVAIAGPDMGDKDDRRDKDEPEVEVGEDEVLEELNAARKLALELGAEPEADNG